MTTTATQPSGWRIVDIVVAAAVAVAFGVVFLAWNALYAATVPIFAFLPPAQAIMYGVWLLPGVLVGLIVRRPGRRASSAGSCRRRSRSCSARRTASTRWSPARSRAPAPSWRFAIGLYRRWTLPFAILAGALAGALRGRARRPGLLPGHRRRLLGRLRRWRRSSAAPLVAGIGAWLLVRALVATGVLRDFAVGREQREV